MSVRTKGPGHTRRMNGLHRGWSQVVVSLTSNVLPEPREAPSTLLVQHLAYLPHECLSSEGFLEEVDTFVKTA
jgi:hypothetical protein